MKLTFEDHFLDTEEIAYAEILEDGLWVVMKSGKDFVIKTDEAKYLFGMIFPQHLVVNYG